MKYIGYIVLGFLLHRGWQQGVKIYNENKTNATCLRALEQTGYYKLNVINSHQICNHLSKLQLGE